MRDVVLTLLLVVGFESSGLAFDIPPPAPMHKVIETAANRLFVSETGTLIGGVMLAAALVVGGLWLIRKRKVKR